MKYNNIRTPCLYPIPVFWAGAYRLEGRRVLPRSSVDTIFLYESAESSLPDPIPTAVASMS
ncbi:hypothetical protein BS299_20315 [Mycobacterium tuberculosis M13]|nr:hypothetical protein BS299_20315 [Mycobacterium tuberculosis M13]